MKAMLIEGQCEGCLLRALEIGLGRDLSSADAPADPENAPERQLEQLERSFGPDWKW